MRRSPEVLLLDDGELDDVQAMLEELGAAFGRVRGGAIAQDTPAPSKLLITTPRRIESVSMPEPDSERANGLTRIVVVNEDSVTLRARLREIGFDYLVRRPVHPEALRLLLLHGLYSGEERRDEPRVPVGFEISFRSGLLSRKATLADLSSRGCRLISKYALEPGKRISVTIPRSSQGSDTLTLKGRVIRMGLDERLGPVGPYSSAIGFDELPPDTRHDLEWILEELRTGPATLGETRDKKPARPRAQPEPPTRTVLDPPETRSEDLQRVDIPVEVQMSATPGPEPEAPPVRSAPAVVDERRKARRADYSRRVPAFGDRAMRVLVARDLSTGGMRVERSSGLDIGDRLHLAVYVAGREEPMLVWATVARDDGENGMGLVFDEVDPAMASELERLVAGLPAVECLHDEEAQAMGTVVTEILES